MFVGAGELLSCVLSVHEHGDTDKSTKGKSGERERGLSLLVGICMLQQKQRFLFFPASALVEQLALPFPLYLPICPLSASRGKKIVLLA